MKKKVLIILLTFKLIELNAQTLEGKWVMINDEDTYAIPGCMVIEVTKEKLITYSFDSIVGISKLSLDTINKIFKQTEKNHIEEFKYYLKDSLHLTHYQVGIESSDNGEMAKIFEWNYTKLLFTEINYPIEKIITKLYVHFYPTSFIRQESRIKFENFSSSNNTKILKNYENNSFYKLEKIDETYFIVFYWRRNQRKWIVPIKEINEDHLVVYGVAGREGFVKIQEIKDIKIKQHLFFPHD